MKKLTPAQTWAVLEVVFDRRVGICFALQKLKEAGLLSHGGYTDRGTVNQVVRKYGRRHGFDGGWFWPIVETHADAERLAFIRMQRRIKKRRRTK